MSTRALLAATGSQWSLRTSRTQVLGTVAARSDVLDHWASEDPDSGDLPVMRARVAVELAVACRREGRQAVPLERAAREACWRAVEAVPEDPVPWVCLLALAPLDVEQRLQDHRHEPPDAMLSPGPWGLFWQAHDRDPFNREASHRILRYWLGRSDTAAAAEFTRYVLPHVPVGSPLLVLPLLLHVEQYRRARRKDGVRGQWRREPYVTDTARAFDGWRGGADQAEWTVVDLSYLAHALWGGHRMADAAMVFDALGPFASWFPWMHLADRPELAENVLLTAQVQADAGRAATALTPS